MEETDERSTEVTVNPGGTVPHGGIHLRRQSRGKEAEKEEEEEEEKAEALNPDRCNHRHVDVIEHLCKSFLIYIQVPPLPPPPPSPP